MGTDSVIFIRTDGNTQIATGHLVRCLCITEALEKEGKQVIFLLSDEDSLSLLRELSSSLFSGIHFHYETRILPNAKFDNLEAELWTLTNFLTNYKNSVLLIDSYYVTDHYLTSLKPYAKLAYMDDLRSFDYDVDLVINYDVIPPSRQSEYELAYRKATKCLLGAEYTPLRPQFQNQTYELNKEIKNILVTTGGSDPYSFCETFASAFLAEKKEITLHIVIGKLFPDTTVATLKQMDEMSPLIKLHYNITNMADLMKQCDCAISAAGTTLYELCAIGVPAISFTFADNQLTTAKTFAETGAVLYAGDLRTKKESLNPSQKSPATETICNINQLVNQMITDFDTRSKLHSKMKTQVPQNGASKIAKALCRLA